MFYICMFAFKLKNKKKDKHVRKYNEKNQYHLKTRYIQLTFYYTNGKQTNAWPSKEADYIIMMLYHY